MIPDSFGVDDDDGSLNADAETISLAPMDESLWSAETEFLQAAFQKLPCSHALDRVTALGFGRGGAEENMTLVGVEVQRLSDGGKIRHEIELLGF